MSIDTINPDDYYYVGTNAVIGSGRSGQQVLTDGGTVLISRVGDLSLLDSDGDTIDSASVFDIRARFSSFYAFLSMNGKKYFVVIYSSVPWRKPRSVSEILNSDQDTWKPPYNSATLIDRDTRRLVEAIKNFSTSLA